MGSGKVGYYGEFVAYPVLIGSFAAAALWRVSPERSMVWMAAFISGVGLWTLVEYALHRYVLHHVPYIKEMHDAHHNEQKALVGTPIWLSLGLFVAFAFLPLRLFADPTVAAGITGGLMLGYLCFEGVHHIIHHWQINPGTYGYRLKRRHLLHHHFDDKGNFGVTTGFWDAVFRTDVRVRGSTFLGD